MSAISRIGLWPKLKRWLLPSAALSLGLGACGPVFNNDQQATEFKPRTSFTTNLDQIPLAVKAAENENITKYRYSEPVEVTVDGVSRQPVWTACETKATDVDWALTRTYVGWLPLTAGEAQLTTSYRRIENDGSYLRHVTASAKVAITYDPDFSTAGKELLYLFNREQKTIYVTEVENGELLGKISLDLPDASDYQLQLVGANLLVYNNHNLIVIDTATNKSVASLDFSRHFPAGETLPVISASEDGQSIYLGYENFLYIIDRSTNTRIAMFPLNQKVTHISNAFLAGRLLVAAQNSVYAFDPQTLSGLGSYTLPVDIGSGAVIEKLFLSFDQQVTAALVRQQSDGPANHIRLINTATLEGVGEYQGGEEIANRNIAISPDRNRLYYVEGTSYPRVVAVSLESGENLWESEGSLFSLTNDGNSLLLLEDGRADCNLADWMTRLDAKTGGILKKDWLGMDLQGLDLVHKS